MKHAGLDVSLETTSVCVVDEEGWIRLETQCASEPAAVIAALEKTDVAGLSPAGAMIEAL